MLHMVFEHFDIEIRAPLWPDWALCVFSVSLKIRTQTYICLEPSSRPGCDIISH